MGFRNEQGDHTNSIESIWSNLKMEIKSRRGIMLCNLEEFVKESQTVIWHKKGNVPEQINDFFINIINKI